LEDVASTLRACVLYFSAIFQGIFKSKASVRSLRGESPGGIIQNPLADFVQRKFEPRPESTAKFEAAGLSINT